MMKPLFIVVLLVFSVFGCSLDDQRWFITKQLNAPFPIIPNPYTNPSPDYLDKVNASIHDKNSVCTVHYLNPSRSLYELETFPNESSVPSTHFITHQGHCTACSTLQDLWIYLTTDLTRTVRKCGVLNFYSTDSLRSCIKRIGFTDACTEVWLWNTINTRKHCNRPCIYALATNEPFVINGNLNKCLQCDEDISGPIFKYESGRTRRNSGIHSEIDRPEDQIYNVTHCYY